MKSKMFAICSSVAALHLIVGGAVILGGCTGVQEDEPMPFGAYVPPQPKTETAAEPAVEPAATETETTEETVVDEPIVEPAGKDDSVVEPAVEPTVEPEVTPAVKGDTPKTIPVKGDTPETAKAIRANDVEYIVKKGDSYWKIAKMYGISTATLVAYNDIAPEKLRPGQKIMIPASGKKVTQKVAVKPQVKVKKSYAPIPADGIYVVQKGDSFYKIAVKFGLRAKDIAEYNNIPLTKTLQVNQKLKLPRKDAAQPAPQDAQPVLEDAQPAPQDTVPAEKETQGTDYTLPSEVVAPEAETIDVPKGGDVVAAPDLTEVADAPSAVQTAEDVKTAAMTEAVLESDTTLEELVKNSGLSEAEIRQKNPDIPADGVIKAGTTIKY